MAPPPEINCSIFVPRMSPLLATQYHAFLIPRDSTWLHSIPHMLNPTWFYTWSQIDSISSLSWLSANQVRTVREYSEPAAGGHGWLGQQGQLLGHPPAQSDSVDSGTELLLKWARSTLIVSPNRWLLAAVGTVFDWDVHAVEEVDVCDWRAWSNTHHHVPLPTGSSTGLRNGRPTWKCAYGRGHSWCAAGSFRLVFVFRRLVISNVVAHRYTSSPDCYFTLATARKAAQYEHGPLRVHVQPTGRVPNVTNPFPVDFHYRTEIFWSSSDYDVKNTVLQMDQVLWITIESSWIIL